MIYDITRPISNSIAVWPGDSPAKLTWTATKAQTGSVNVGAVAMSTHTGTHVDAPFHYDDEGHSVDEYDLGIFIGPALVWSAPPVDRLLPEHLPPVGNVNRLLVKSPASLRANDAWSDDFITFEPDTIDGLARIGMRLIGTDGPSFDPMDSKDLPAHHALAKNRIANLENLWLRDVPDGIYVLVALPLALTGMDASPVRAVLMDRESDLHINVTAPA